MGTLQELIEESIQRKDNENVGKLLAEDEDVAALRSHAGYEKLFRTISKYYLGAAEANMAEGGKRTDYWKGVRGGLTLFFELISDSVSRMKVVQERIEQQRQEEDLTEPGADFIGRLGGSHL
jgi:hypothetical protein